MINRIFFFQKIKTGRKLFLLTKLFFTVSFLLSWIFTVTQKNIHVCISNCYAVFRNSYNLFTSLHKKKRNILILRKPETSLVSSEIGQHEKICRELNRTKQVITQTLDLAPKKRRKDERNSGVASGDFLGDLTENTQGGEGSKRDL